MDDEGVGMRGRYDGSACAGPGLGGRSGGAGGGGRAARSRTSGTRSRATPPQVRRLTSRPASYRAFTLDEAAPAAGLAAAPKAGARARGEQLGRALAARRRTAASQRFEVYEAPIMEAKLAAKHPDIKTYAGRGIDDPTATIRADTSPLGFHASVRSPRRRLVRRPVLPPRRQRLRQLLRARPRRRRGSSSSASVERDSRPRRQGRQGRRRAGGPAAHLPARAGHRPDVRDLLRRPGQRHRGQGHADEPRQPDLRGRDGDPDGPDRRQRQAQPQHGGAGRPAPNGPCGAAACYTTASSSLRRRARAATGS